MQPKKSATGKKTSGSPAFAPAVGDSEETTIQSRVGRPPTSSLDRKGQVRENVRAHRAKLKAAGLEKVEVYLPKGWCAFLRGTGRSFQQLGVEAFTALLQARGASALIEEVKPVGDDTLKAS